MKNVKLFEEFVSEGMVSPKRGHNFYKLTEDTQIKYTKSFGGIGKGTPGVLLHANGAYFIGVEDAYIIDYFGALFYVDMDNDVAMRIQHEKNQNKEFTKNLKPVSKAPAHDDWKHLLKD